MKLQAVAGGAALVFLAQVCLAEPRGWTLADVIAATRKNPVARAAIAERRAAEAQAAAARAARFPQLQLLSFLGPSPSIRCEDPQCTRTSPTEVRLDVEGIFAGLRLEVLQPLYTFGKLDAAARAGEGAARLRGALAEGTILDLALEATRAYYGVELARDLGRMLEDGARQVREAKQTLAERLASGDAQVTVQDRLRLDAFETEVSLRLSEAREKERTALEGLRALCGDRDADVAEPSLLPIERTLSPVERYWQTARAANPELQAAEHGVAALGQRRALEQASWFPDLALTGSFALARAQGVDDAPSAFANDPFNATTATIAAVLRWKLEPALQLARIEQASEEQQRARALLDAARAKIEFVVRDAHQRAAEARTRLDLARQGERSARGWVTSVLQADAVGVGSARDLADAYLTYFTLRGRLLQSIYDWNVALAALERATGESSAHPQSDREGEP